MSFVHGKNAAALLNAVEVTSYVNSGELSADVDTAETTTWGNTWKTFIPGVGGFSASLGGYFDPTFTPNFTDLLSATPGAVLTVGPGGLAQAAVCRLINVIGTAYKESAPIGGAVAFTWEAMSDTVPGFGVVLKPLAAVTEDANGTTVDGGAQTTTGAIAHLHVTEVSDSDTVDVTIEDSSTGSSGWATIGTFAQVSAASAERIVIAGTVKRYTRAVWDVTGSDVSITFAVALART